MHARTLAVAALAALTIASAPASADPLTETHYDGGCAYDTVVLPATSEPDRFRGAMFGRLVAYSPTPERNPVTVTAMRCELRRDGVPLVTAQARTSGPFAVVEPTPVDVVAGETQVLAMCLVLDTIDALGTATSVEDCGRHHCPPEGYCGYEWLLDAAFAKADGVLTEVVDPVACPVLAAAGQDC